jgi:hypothetical protein
MEEPRAPPTAVAVAPAAQAATVYLGFTADPVLAAAVVLYIVALVSRARLGSWVLAVQRVGGLAAAGRPYGAEVLPAV